MATKQYVEFLATGDITWVSKSNLERRKHVHKGDRLHVRVVQQADDYELWDGNWSVLMPAKNVRIVEYFPISFDVYKGEQKISSHAVRSEKEKREVLKPLRRLYGKVEVRNEGRTGTVEQPVVEVKSHQHGSSYVHHEVDVNVTARDTDVIVRLPNGDQLVLQFRVDGPSVDICLPDNMEVINLQGDGMEPAEAVKGKGGGSHVRKAKQLCIPLAPSVLYEGEAPSDQEEFLRAIRDGRYDGDTELFMHEVLAVYGNKKATWEKLRDLMTSHDWDHEGQEAVLNEFTSIGLGLRNQ